MSIKETRICDGCGEKLEHAYNRYHLVSDGFPDIPSGRTEVNYLYLDFCESCTRRLLEVLEHLAVKKEDTDG